MLPIEVWVQVFVFVDCSSSLLSLSCVCKIFSDDDVWKQVYREDKNVSPIDMDGDSDTINLPSWYHPFRSYFKLLFIHLKMKEKKYSKLHSKWDLNKDDDYMEEVHASEALPNKAIAQRLFGRFGLSHGPLCLFLITELGDIIQIEIAAQQDYWLEVSGINGKSVFVPLCNLYLHQASPFGRVYLDNIKEFMNVVGISDIEEMEIENESENEKEEKQPNISGEEEEGRNENEAIVRQNKKLFIFMSGLIRLISSVGEIGENVLHIWHIIRTNTFYMHMYTNQATQC